LALLFGVITGICGRGGVDMPGRGLPDSGASTKRMSGRRATTSPPSRSVAPAPSTATRGRGARSWRWDQRSWAASSSLLLRW